MESTAGYSHHTLHVSETLGGNGTRKFSTLFTNLHKFTYDNVLVAVMGNYLISADLYSTICGLQFLILGF